jgi:ubiquinone/menaquinone biosynthesis C-methylase UbiE
MKKESVTNRIRHHFDALASTYNTTGEWINNTELLEDIYSFTKSGLTLEVGVGTGIVSEYLNKSPKGLFCVGIDPSPVMCSYAWKRGIPCIMSATERMPFRSQLFTNIICRQVLHYVVLNQTLKEWKRVLHPEGIVIVSQIVSETIEELRWWKKVKHLVQPLRRRWFALKDIDIIADKYEWKIVGIKTRRISITHSVENFFAELRTSNVRTRFLLEEWQETSPCSIDFRFNKNIVRFNELWATWAMVQKSR